MMRELGLFFWIPMDRMNDRQEKEVGQSHRFSGDPRRVGKSPIEEVEIPMQLGQVGFDERSVRFRALERRKEVA